MKIFSNKIKVPILFHLKEFSYGKTLSVKALDKILEIKNIVGLKEHNNSINIRKNILLGMGLKKICYDGFSKEDFISTSKFGVKSRHI